MIALIIFSLICFIIIWFVIFKVTLKVQKRNLFKNIPEKLEKQDKIFFNDGKEVNFKELLGKEENKKAVVIPKEKKKKTFNKFWGKKEEKKAVVIPKEKKKKTFNKFWGKKEENYYGFKILDKLTFIGIPKFYKWIKDEIKYRKYAR